MKNKFILTIIFLTCLLFSCEKESDDFVRGEVLIGLEDGVEKHQVKNRIEELNLEWKRYFEHLGIALIGVPVGKEKYWVEKLKEEPLIKYAQLNHKVDLRNI